MLVKWAPGDFIQNGRGDGGDVAEFHDTFESFDNQFIMMINLWLSTSVVDISIQLVKPVSLDCL